jgi:hypothetical protein
MHISPDADYPFTPYPDLGGDLTAEQVDHIVRGLRGAERWNQLNKIYRAHFAATIPPARG